MTTAADARARLERRANIARSRLWRTLDVLDARRHRVAEHAHTAERLALPAGLSLLGIATLTTTTAFLVHVVSSRRRARTLHRLRRAVAAWQTAGKRPFWASALGQASLSVACALSSVFACRRLSTQHSPRLPSGAPPPCDGAPR